MLKRLIPSSLLAQVMTVLTIGLLAAQIISAFLLYQAAEQRRDAGLVNAIAFRIVGELARLDQAPGQRGRRGGMDAGETGPNGRRPPAPLPRPFAMRAERGEALTISSSETRIENYESALRSVLAGQGIAAGDIAVTRRMASKDPFVRNVMEGRPRLRVRQPDWETRPILVAAIERADRPGWLTVRIAEPKRAAQGPLVIAFQTLVILAVLVLLLYLVLRRITRPLALLTQRVDDFSQRPDRVVELPESGPADTRRLIAAHNAMEARVAGLLDEKDVMLGAIGHDLKTPLAALRVRIESVPDDTQRARMAQSIEDITATLDDILSLARIGHLAPHPEATDLAELAISVVEEFEDLGDPVSIAETPRLVAKVHVTWARRALRNLISNAVRYGENAKVSVFETGGHAVLRVDDSGPGIPAGKIAAMLEPFARGEASRNRATGGAGLGLTLARAIADQHGGRLVLSNLEENSDTRNQTGLRAELHLPL